VATYRLQFNRHFTLREAAAIVPYLAELGISDPYASPLLAARAGSLHGYDVVDPSRLNPELGTEEDLEAFARELRARGMGLLLDLVPNHMCVADPSNRWWADVLENGPSSPYARYFDIDWRPPKAELANKVLLPILGDQYGRVLENQELRIVFQGGAFFVEVYDKLLPLAPRSWKRLLEPALGALRRTLPEADPHRMELESILTALEYLPGREESAPEKVRERTREKEVIRRRLAALVESSPDVRAAVERSLEDVNGRRGDPRSFDRLEALLEDQAYRLCFWQVATDEINYRRFFDLNELAAIRVEDPEVFEAVHGAVLEYVRRGWVTGLRIDHVDGLYDPLAYLRSLQGAAARALGAPEDPGRLPLYVVVEKILMRDERLSPDWPVHGTTGYDFLNVLNGLFVDPRGAEALGDFYRRFAGGAADVREALATCKKFIMHVAMASELFMLTCRLDAISEQHRWSRDFTRESQRFALREVVAWFPVYRTYIRGEGEAISAEDRRHVREAVLEARRRSPATSPSLFEFIRQVWLLEHPDGLTEAQREERRQFVMRLQQFTGPVMAKGLEDTLFYRYFPLASANEVGAEPGRLSASLEEFHARNAERVISWPHALLATSTHDTKRGEDVRARLNVLSEIPGPWASAAERWRRLNRPHKTVVEGREAPDANEEYLYYQTLVGAWPLGAPSAAEWEEFARRIEEYMIKALREAKVHTSWITPNEPYEAAARQFVRRTLDRAASPAFLADVAEFQGPVGRAGMLNSLSQIVLKIASPGVPDFYQGTEVWDLSLVDPDNRRPVDYARRRELLASLREEEAAAPQGLAARLLARPEDGRVKMHVTRAALRFRGAARDLFERGSYVPLSASGARSAHVCAFARRLGPRAAVAAAGRFFLALGAAERPPVGRAAWGDTALALPADLSETAWRDALTGRRIRAGATLALADLFAELPAALLEAVS
jgi:(1->4)-alpha-D-glucan 1-alpha-D-glucosylmutase